MLQNRSPALLLMAMAAALAGVFFSPGRGMAEESHLPNTKLLAHDPKAPIDYATEMVDGIDRFLLDQTAQSLQKRAAHWKRDFSSPEAYNRSVEPNRKRLAYLIGASDKRVAFDGLEYVATTSRPALVAKGPNYEVYNVRWPVLDGVHGEGLLLTPTTGAPIANVVAIPDCNQTPEQLCGLAPGTPEESQFARRLAESGCRVIVPTLISRKEKVRNISNREWVYRCSYELGHHVIGYEVQKILAAVDWFSTQTEPRLKTAVVGWGEGGLLALYAAALDTRIDAACVSGYFDDRSDLWQEPIDRNQFSLLSQFGDAELATLVAPRKLIVEAARAAEVVMQPVGSGAPGRIVTPTLAKVQAEVERARKLTPKFSAERYQLVTSGTDGKGPPGSGFALESLLAVVSAEGKLQRPLGQLTAAAPLADAAAREARQVQELEQYNERLFLGCQKVREKFFWEKLNYDSVEKFKASAEPLRTYFANDVIGRIELPVQPANPRTRLVEENDRWKRYEVMLDVFPDVFAYGLLTIPKSIKPGEKRPVVVCQHGLEGRPTDTIGEKERAYYSAFSTELAERGFITFAPQNPYIFRHRFRSLQRKANPLGKTLFSIIVPQHQQIVDWLQTLPEVDADKIGFYGLSYGGKSAMRIPSLVTDYALSICSGDFNEWIAKNISARYPNNYLFTPEYEMFEFDLANTFNYAEMVGLIAPRPFMVERGHFDGVGTDEAVAGEYARARRVYAVGLKMPERTEIEWFVGGHKINGQGTFAFLQKHLFEQLRPVTKGDAP
ncbi:MAG: dienelactone hydrolase family protein [Planctomycetota bacterium]|nr:dienelactone hydrolase family protein [Planctomycetota bacterium]